MKEKTIISTITLLTSLAGYFYAKGADKDPVPIVMVSGFFGALLGERIYRMVNEKNRDDDPPPGAAAMSL